MGVAARAAWPRRWAPALVAEPRLRAQRVAADGAGRGQGRAAFVAEPPAGAVLGAAGRAGHSRTIGTRAAARTARATAAVLGARPRRSVQSATVLRALEKMLGIDDAGRPRASGWRPRGAPRHHRSRFVLIGQITAAPLYVSIPNGVVIAFVMAGLTVACMMPAGGDAPPDDPPAATTTTAPSSARPAARGRWSRISGRAAPADADRVPTAVPRSADPRQRIPDEHVDHARAAEARCG